MAMNNTSISSKITDGSVSNMKISNNDKLSSKNTQKEDFKKKKSNELKQLIYNLNNYIILTHSEENSEYKQIKRNKVSQFYKTIGRDRLLVSREYKATNNKIAKFMESLLIDESKNNFTADHLTIRDIHRYSSFRVFVFVIPLLYIMPLYFIFRGSSIRKMSFMRFTFCIPMYFMYKPLMEHIKTYVTHREAINMLYCVEKFYKNEGDKGSVVDKYKYEKVNKLYKTFMDDSKLCFKNVKEIEDDKQVKL